MAIAYTVEKYLNMHDIPYDVIKHPHTQTSLKTAYAAQIEGDCLAKAVLLEDDDGYIMAVLPATHHVKLGMLRHQMGRQVRMASEREVSDLFQDCERGAIPALGQAYGIETILDDSLMEHRDIYFEAGDHEELIHMSCEQFEEAMSSAMHGQFSSST